MAGETTKPSLTEMSAPTNMEPAQTIPSKAAPMQIMIHGQMWMMNSLMTRNSGKILTLMDLETIMVG